MIFLYWSEKQLLHSPILRSQLLYLLKVSDLFFRNSTETYLEPNPSSMIELFCPIFSGYKPLVILAKKHQIRLVTSSKYVSVICEMLVRNYSNLLANWFLNLSHPKLNQTHIVNVSIIARSKFTPWIGYINWTYVRLSIACSNCVLCLESSQ